MKRGPDRSKIILASSFLMIAFVAPVVLGEAVKPLPAEASIQFGTIPPQTATFQAPFTETPPAATHLPTVAAGQEFVEGEEDALPEVARPDLLEHEALGYSAILGEPGLYLVWSLDDNGRKQYYVVEKDSEFFARIVKIVDENLMARRTLDESNPLFSMIWSGTKALVGEVGFFICGGATIATVEVPPIAGVFGACTLGSLGLFGTSLDEFFDNANSVRAYENRTEEDRLAINGILREVDAAPHP